MSPLRDNRLRFLPALRSPRRRRPKVLSIAGRRSRRSRLLRAFSSR